MCDIDKRGQALVEFVLILPILIFMILAFIDISRLMIMKNHLESLLQDTTNATTSINDQEYNISVLKQDGFITLKSCIDVITPGFNKVLGNPSCISVSKEIRKEG